MQSKVNIQNKARKHLVENSLTLFYVFKEMHEYINTYLHYSKNFCSLYTNTESTTNRSH